jgi:hypothetical protein
MQSVPITNKVVSKWRGVLITTLSDTVCQRPGIPVSSTNKIDIHDITNILVKMALNTITSPYKLFYYSVLKDKDDTRNRGSNYNK